LDGDTELLPGITAVVTQGHTRYHQGVKIESEGRTAFYLGDLIPTVCHLPLPYIMGYDLSPLQTLETKRWVLDRLLKRSGCCSLNMIPWCRPGVSDETLKGRYVLDEVTV
jgi:hypothetical protein